ncbi:MAG: CopG family transcriptional regulator [Elusimicrobiota bacterium]
MKAHIKRTTIYLDERLHHALQIKAIETSHSVSDLITESVRYSLAEDAADYEAYERRKNEPAVTFENVLKELKKNGKI